MRQGFARSPSFWRGTLGRRVSIDQKWMATENTIEERRALKMQMKGTSEKIGCGWQIWNKTRSVLKYAPFGGVWLGKTPQKKPRASAVSLFWQVAFSLSCHFWWWCDILIKSAWKPQGQNTLFVVNICDEKNVFYVNDIQNKNKNIIYLDLQSVHKPTNYYIIVSISSITQ